MQASEQQEIRKNEYTPTQGGLESVISEHQGYLLSLHFFLVYVECIAILHALLCVEFLTWRQWRGTISHSFNSREENICMNGNDEKTTERNEMDR